MADVEFDEDFGEDTLNRQKRSIVPQRSLMVKVIMACGARTEHQANMVLTVIGVLCVAVILFNTLRVFPGGSRQMVAGAKIETPPNNLLEAYKN